ncbi:MAG TPA: cytochrome C oxidase subunit IV family protein [Anaerolineae bacterium]|nr:cytochrome C oxidase subunit IV family protein [Anaerolineae bacterium]
MPRTLFIVCGSLLVLTLFTIGASLLNLGIFHTPVALGIAAAKAILILLYFMHIRYSSGLTRIVIFVGLLWLALLIGGTMDDVLTRGWVNGTSP